MTFRDLKSSRACLAAGVPQDSVLLPLLFNLYVNDFSSAISECRVFQYADDTLMVSSHANYDVAIEKLQKDLVLAMDWFQSNLIRVNSSKTKLVCFKNPQKKVELSTTVVLHTSDCMSCDCIPIPYVNSVKYLGIHFDSDLSWCSHMMYLCKRLRSVSCCLYNVKMFMPFSVRR